MEPGPLPPHERSWRHPSELGPTRLQVEGPDRGGRTNIAALAGGTAAVMAVALLVVSMTPRTSSGPVALSATTAVIAGTATLAPDPAPTPLVRAQSMQLGVSGSLLASFSAFPHSVTRVSPLGLDGTAIADALPNDDDVVLVRTDAVTYQMRWSDAESMTAPDGSVVFDSDGELIAHVAAGALINLVDD